MKRKVVLAVCILLFVGLLSGFLIPVCRRARAEKRMEAITRAVQARNILWEHFGTDLGHHRTYTLAEDIITYYIGTEDLKLHIRILEESRFREAEISEALGEYADTLVWEYADPEPSQSQLPEMTQDQLSERAQEIGRLLKEAGYSEKKVKVGVLSGFIRIYVKEVGKIPEIVSWIQSQDTYPFEFSEEILSFACHDHIRGGSGCDATVYPEENGEEWLKCHEAQRELLAYLESIGGYQTYKEFYLENYISRDCKLHIFLKDTADKAQVRQLRKHLKAYSSVTVIEFWAHYGKEGEAEAWEMENRFVEALWTLGLWPGTSGLSSNNIPSVGMGAPGDRELVRWMLEWNGEYFFGGEPFPIRLD